MAGLVVFASYSQGAERMFTYAMDGAPESLDSAKSSSDRSVWVTWLLCDSLINVSKDGQSLERGVAESWTVSRDGLQARIRLRGGVRFHDGTVLDARAVKASFERHFQPSHELYTPDPKNTKEQLLRDLIESIDVDDELTLLFKLKYPGLHYLSQIDIVSPTAAGRLGRDFGRRPVCSGPFKFDSWSDDRITLVANDQYWAGRPKIDRVVFRFLPEAKGLVDALLKGEVDFAPTVRDTFLFERVRESSRASLVAVPALNIYYLGFYTERPPFDNPLVRRAVAHAVNVSRMALFLGRGAAVAAKGPLAPAMKGHDPAVAQAAYDPDAARALLAKAGHDQRLNVGLVHNSAVTLDSEVAGAIQADLRRVGMTVDSIPKPTFGEMFKAVQERAGHMFLYSWHVRAPYPERLLVPLFHSRSSESTNLTRYKNPTLDRLLDEAVRLPEGPTQKTLYSRIQNLIVDDAPMVFLYHATRMAAVGDRVHGLELNLGALPHDKLVNVDLRP